MSELPSNEASKPASTADDIIDLLGSDDEVVKEPKEEKSGTEPELDDDIEIIDKEDKVDEKEEKLELKDDEVEIDTPPRKREVIKEFPELFKKFPWFEKMMYRDREMTEMFGSFDGAKEAAEKASVFDELEGYVSGGSSEEFLQRVKDNDNAAFNKLTKNLLPNLQKVDREAYLYVVTDVVKRVLLEANSQGKRADNEDLQNAASILAGFVFPNGMSAPEDEVEKGSDPELEKERAEFQSERLSAAVSEVQGRIGNLLRNTVEQYIDPKDQMTSYVKKTAIRDVLEGVDSQLKNDIAFRKNISKMWQEAQSGKYSRPLVDKIKSAYISRAKPLLKKAIIDARREALKDAQPSRRKEREETPSRRGIISTGRSTSQSSGKPQMKSGESVMDFLTRDD